MSEAQFHQFHERLRRIHRIHRRGGGFEAEGTLGQSYYTRQARRAARPIFRPMLAIVAVVLLVKAISAASMPSGEYAARVDTLRTGSVVEQASAFIMAPDPISTALAKQLAPLIASVN